MLRCFQRNCSIAGIFTVACALLFAPTGCNKSPESEKGSQNAKTTGDKVDPEFAVPNGKPEKILEFIAELRSRKQKFATQEKAFEHTLNVLGAMIEAGDKILAQRATDDELREGAALKMVGTVSQAAIRDRESLEFKQLAKNALVVVDTLRKDKRAPVAEVANQFSVSARALNFNTLTEDERAALAKDAIQNVKNLKLAQEPVMEASYVADQFVEAGQVEDATSIFNELAQLLKDSPDQQTRSLAATLYGKGMRLGLIGHPIKLEGRLLNGETLDWDSYRGKVVFVDFWATWCGPCVADLPNVKALYDKYHSRGFDVLGISLDRKLGDVKSFVKAKSLPWPQLFDEKIQDTQKHPSPMAMRFSIQSIPTAFLIGADGNVISVNAHASELDPVLSKLLENAADNPKSSADDSATSP